MKRAMLVDVGRVEVEEVADVSPANGEVLVKVKACGICGSDLHYFLEGGLGSFKSKMPLHIGHEPAGIVIDPGSSVRFRRGDRVAVDPNRPCLHCEMCQKGHHNLCKNGTFMGAGATHGALQEYVVVDEHQLVSIPSTMTFEEAAMMEPLGVAMHALRQVPMSLGISAAIFGAGPIGLSILALCKLIGVGTTFVVDRLEWRLNMAYKVYCATNVMNDKERKANPVQFVKELTFGQGADVAFDAAGKQETVDACFQVAAVGGKVVLVGIPTYDYLKYNPHLARTKELTVYNVRRSNQTLADCVDLWKRDMVSVAPMVTHRYSIDQAQEAFETAANYRDGVVKAMVVF